MRLHGLPDGMCELVARLPALLGVAILDRLTQAAKAAPVDDSRTIHQRRADAAAELLLCGQAPDDAALANAIAPVLTVMIPATALTADEATSEGREPCVLDGRSLVDPGTARRLAGGAGDWERLFVSPVTGLAVATDRYRPTAAQRRWLRARDGRCRFPGCSMPAHRADADHTRDHALGGATATANLALLCRRHHVIKHATRWRVRQSVPGVLERTSPIGTLHTDRPDPVAPGPRFAAPPGADGSVGSAAARRGTARRRPVLTSSPRAAGAQVPPHGPG
ncbi:DUF222 domain-containing protein [Agrococcus sp. SL85]|uniref:HNH endonuclease signature motif containing protein n=1 Tax=Agrococcus sp. SL85 TaxID=2995141 RepID=UPI00226C9281|nr:HNH endonuclease signature motif containing protein [Agrococcus sp. SL85]WAC65934.1 DUF222 domain-containing protein [Agrococcus sp. SL85]